GDLIEIIVDRNSLTGSINLVGTKDGPLTPEEAERLLAEREPHPLIQPDENLPDDTRLWAALQSVSGGTWGGCVYDVETIIKTLEAGKKALQSTQEDLSENASYIKLNWVKILAGFITRVEKPRDGHERATYAGN